jgi:hypothetical protein
MCLTKLEVVTEQRTIGYKLMLKDKDGNLRFIINGEKVSLGEDLVANEVHLVCKDGTPYRGGFHYLDEKSRDELARCAVHYDKAMKMSIERSRKELHELPPFEGFNINECTFVMVTCEVQDTHTKGGFWDDAGNPDFKGYVCSKIRLLSVVDIVKAERGMYAI